MLSITRCCFGKTIPCSSQLWDEACKHNHLPNLNFHSKPAKHLKNAFLLQATCGKRAYLISGAKHAMHVSEFDRPSWITYATEVDGVEEPSTLLEEENSKCDGEVIVTDPSEKVLPQKMEAEELKSLLVDSERTKLIRKLSEANQHNRFLKRQLQIKEDSLVDCISELAFLEHELKNIIELAEEVTNSGNQQDSRKTNGKYTPSYLLSRLEAFQAKLKEQTKGVDTAKFKDVELLWFGMAEMVQVMGSFDGWNLGEDMSPEYTGDFTKFSATLKLRPGRYEIKFLVDGQWRLSPELPVIGDGLMQNNLLVVE